MASQVIQSGPAPRLSFSLDHVQEGTSHTQSHDISSSNARTGTLSFSNGQEISTPAIVGYTRKGSMPHLSRDNLNRLPVEMVMLAYEHFLEYNPPMYLAAPYGIKRYLGLRHDEPRMSSPQGTQSQAAPRPSHIVFATLRDAADQAEIIGNTDQFVACRSFRGVNKATPELFEKISLPKPPDVLLALADEPLGHTSSSKRLQKSVLRSEKWLHQLLKNEKIAQTNIFVPLIGGHNPAARREYTTTIESVLSSVSNAQTPIAGYSVNLNAIRVPDHAGLLSSSPVEASTNVCDLVAASFSAARSDKARLAICPNGPHEMLDLVVRNGMDLYVDEWSSAMSSMGIALDFMLPLSSASSGIAAAPSQAEPSEQSAQRQLGINLFDLKYSREISSLASPDTVAELQKRYGAEALGDLPTKAYVHHLLQTHEMTSHVLLAMHNTCIMDMFMHDLREAIQAGRAEEARHAFGTLYDKTMHAWSAAQEEWNRVHSERGKGRLKGIGQERKDGNDAGTPLPVMQT